MPTLDELVEFNQALIYAFEPESTLNRLNGSDSFVDGLIPDVGQHEDVLAAYLYAQNTILPLIRKEGLEKIDETILLEWIKTLHSLIGKTVLEIEQGKAGNYVESVVFCWHQGMWLNSEIGHYLSGLHQCKEEKQFAKFLQLSGIASADALLFVLLLNKVKKASNIIIPDALLATLNRDESTYVGVLTFYKLAVAYQGGQLTDKEKALVFRIVKICRLPDDIPGAMQTFAHNTLDKLRSLDTKSLPEIAKFLTQCFYQFVDIHPFANANGRTATCLLNIFLRAFNLPSILLRHPGENTNLASEYSQAMTKIDKSLEPLQLLILNRIRIAQKRSFEDTHLKNILVLRIELVNLLKGIKQKHPSYDIENIKLMFGQQLHLLKEENDVSYLKLAFKIAVQEEKSLDKEKIKPLLPLPIDEGKAQEVVAALNKLTGQTDWKKSTKQGLMVWIELSDEKTQQNIIETLNALRAGNFTPAFRADNRVPVVRCTAINIDKIIKCSKENLAEKNAPILNP